MVQWWHSLTTLTQVFYGAALFFSLIFLWQFIASLLGLGDHGDFVGGHGDLDMGGGATHLGEGVHTDVDITGVEVHSIQSAADATTAFQVFSLRAILAFCMLFSWAAAMHLSNGKPVETALLLAFAWGLAGWGLVVLLIGWLRKLAETGTSRLASAVGQQGSVYLDIPADGQGEVRVVVSGVVSMVKARAAAGRALKAGTPVRVTKLLNPIAVEVEPAAAQPERKEQGT